MTEWEPNRAHYEKRVNIKTYRNRKLRMLLDEFYLKLTDLEIDHFYALNTHEEIDAYSHQLIIDKL
jgi:hypothetical protein